MPDEKPHPLASTVPPDLMVISPPAFKFSLYFALASTAVPVPVAVSSVCVSLPLAPITTALTTSFVPLPFWNLTVTTADPLASPTVRERTLNAALVTVTVYAVSPSLMTTSSFSPGGTVASSPVEVSVQLPES